MRFHNVEEYLHLLRFGYFGKPFTERLGPVENSISFANEFRGVEGTYAYAASTYAYPNFALPSSR